MIDLLLAREAIVLIAAGAASYVDYKTGYIYDWITYPLIAIGIVLNIAEQNYFGIGLGAITFAIGYALYYTGKIGGGDVKLYAGIAFALPLFNGVFVLRTAVFSALAGIIFLSTYYTLQYSRRGIDWKLNKEGIKKAGLMLFAILAYFIAISYIGILPAPLLLLLIPLLFGAVFLALEQGIKKEFFLQKIKISEIEEDEIPALEFMGEKEKKELGLEFKGVIGEKEKKELEKKGIGEILVYRNLPRFGPFILIGAIMALALPQIIPFGWM